MSQHSTYPDTGRSASSPLSPNPNVRTELAPRFLLHATAAGEFLALTLLFLPALGAIYWGMFARSGFPVIAMSLIGLWYSSRSSGVLSGSITAAAISLLSLITCLILRVRGIPEVPGWLSEGPAGITAWIAVGTLCFLVDLEQLRRCRLWGLSLPEQRRMTARHVVWLIVSLFLIWTLALPTHEFLQRVFGTDGAAGLEELPFAVQAGFRAGEAMITMCFFLLGCNIGSFLNVVVWRMPLGRSIVVEKSRCPACGNAIRGRDNVPILGWLSLGGQCRDCGTPISPRYPVVEAATGLAFLVLYFVELISGGASLPVRPVNLYRGILWTIMYPKWDLISLYLFHCTFLCLLLVLSLMARDSQKPPLRLVTFAIMVLGLTPIVVPSLVLIPVWPAIGTVIRTSVESGLHVVAGSVVGWCSGTLLAFWRRRQHSAADTLLPLMLALCGTVLGWQSVLVISVAWGISELLIPEKGPSATPGQAEQRILLLAFVQLLTWGLQWNMFAGGVVP